MSISSTSPDRTLPLAATSVVFGGKSTSGVYNYSTTLPAGNYVFSAVSLDNNTYSSSYYIWTSADDAKKTASNGGNVYFTIATDSSVQVRPTSLVPITWTQRTNAVPNTALGNSFRYFSETGIYASGNNSVIAYSNSNLTRWTQTNASGQGFDIAYGAGRYVATHRSSYITHSTDLVTWTQVSPSDIVVGGSLNNVVYRNGIFLAVGNRATVATSTDGITWAIRRRGLASGNIGSGFYYDNKFVYFPTNNNSVVNISTDYINWTQTTLTNSYTAQINAYYVGASEVLIGESSGRYLRTTDLVTWTESQIGTNTFTLTGMTKVDSTYIACGSSGNVWYSTDLTNWTQTSASFGTSQVNEVAYGAGIYVAVGAGGRLTSTTDLATTWTARTSGFGTTAINDVRYGNGIFLAVGVSGRVATSTDGITWTGRATASTATLQSAYWDGTYWVCGGATSQYSTDGVTWSSMGNLGINSQANGIFKQGANWYAYGQTTIQRSFSTDLSTWTTHSAGFYDATPLSICEYSNSLYIAAGSVTNATSFASSTDGVTWTNRLANTSNYSIGYAAVNTSNGTVLLGGPVYGGGASTTVLYSTDSISWSTSNATSVMDSSVGGIAYGDGYFFSFATGLSSTSTNIARTSDITSGSWTGYNRTSPSSVFWAAVYNGTSFIVANGTGNSFTQLLTPASPTYDTVGMYFATNGFTPSNSLATSGKGAFVIPMSNGDFYYSTDGNSWEQRNTGLAVDWRSCTYGNGLFLFGGSNGTTYSSTDLVTFTLRNTYSQEVRCLGYSSRFGLYYQGGASATGGFAYSTDAISWTSIYDGSTSAACSVSVGDKTVFVNGSSSVRVSDNGTSFSTATVGAVNWNGTTFGNSTYVVFASASGGSYSSSTDAVTWTSRTIPATNTGLIQFLGGLFYAATTADPSNARIFTSTNAITWTQRFALATTDTKTLAELNGTVVGMFLPSAQSQNPVIYSSSSSNIPSAYYLYRSNLGELA